MPSLLSSILAAYGPAGAAIVLLILALIYKDRAWMLERKALEAQLTAEKDARIADAKAYTDMALNLQKQVIDSVGKVGMILEEVRKQPPRRGL